MKTIFIIGNGRSGTTMLGRILNNNSEVHTFPEIHFFEQLWSKADTERKLTVPTGVELCSLILNISSEGYFSKRHLSDFKNEADLIIENSELTGLEVYKKVLEYETIRNKKNISCKQTPQNVFYVKEILSSFPESKFIFLIRDPRAVMLSQKNKWQRKFLGGKHAGWFETVRAWFNYHPFTIGKLWNAAFSAGIKFKNDRRFLVVKFEDLINTPESTVNEICNFLNIKYDKEMLEVPQVGSSIGKDIAEKKGIRKDRIESWKGGGLNKSELYICEKICRINMNSVGYNLMKLKMPLFGLLFYALIFPFKITGALILNLHRMKNIFETIKKRLAS